MVARAAYLPALAHRQPGDFQTAAASMKGYVHQILVTLRPLGLGERAARGIGHALVFCLEELRDTRRVACVDNPRNQFRSVWDSIIADLRIAWGLTEIFCRPGIQKFE